MTKDLAQCLVCGKHLNDSGDDDTWLDKSKILFTES